jgi:hypothetical protein
MLIVCVCVAGSCAGGAYVKERSSSEPKQGKSLLLHIRAHFMRLLNGSAKKASFE